MTLMARWTYYSPFSPLEAHISKSYCIQLTVICFPFLRWTRGIRVWDNNGCRGWAQVSNDWLQDIRPCDKVRPRCLAPLPPMLLLLPSPLSQLCVRYFSWLILGLSSVLTMIPIGHHWGLILQSCSSPLTPFIPLIWCCLSLSIQRTMMTPNLFSTFFFQISLTSGGYSN